MRDIRSFGTKSSASKIYLTRPVFTSQNILYSLKSTPTVDKYHFDTGPDSCTDRKIFDLTVDNQKYRVRRYSFQTLVTARTEIDITSKFQSYSAEPFIFEPLYDLAANWLNFCYRAGKSNIAFQRADYEDIIPTKGKVLSPFDEIIRTYTHTDFFDKIDVNQKSLFDYEGEKYDPMRLQHIHKLMRDVKSMPITTMVANTAHSNPNVLQTSQFATVTEKKIYERHPSGAPPIIDIQLEDGQNITLKRFSQAIATLNPFATKPGYHIQSITHEQHGRSLVAEDSFPLFLNNPYHCRSAINELGTSEIATENPTESSDIMTAANRVDSDVRICNAKITAQRALLIDPSDFKRSDGIVFNGEQTGFIEKINNVEITFKKNRNAGTIDDHLKQEFYVSPRLNFAYNGILDVPKLSLPPRFF